MQQREPRERVLIRARMRVAQGWRDVTVRNVSRHGMLLRADPAPDPGDYIEVRRNRLVMVARAIWRDGDMFGVRTQDPIDIAALRDDTSAPREVDGQIVERRAPRTTPDQTAQRARVWGQHFQSIVLGAALVVGALLLGAIAIDALRRPLATITNTLAAAHR